MGRTCLVLIDPEKLYVKATDYIFQWMGIQKLAYRARFC